MKRWISTSARVATLLAASIGSYAAWAGQSLYEKGDKKLTFNLTAVGAQFLGQDAWFGESEAFNGANTDDWAEFGVEPGLSFEMGLGGGTLFSEVSGVYTNTSGDDGSGLNVGTDSDNLGLEQANVGWRMDNPFAGLEDDTLSVSIGRQDYSIGTGMLINDGGSDGGHRGGWYIGMRKAFQNSALVKLDSKTLKLEAFRLKNNPRRGGPQGEARGANVDYTLGESGSVTIGGSYMRVYPEGNQANADVYDGRASWTALPGLTFSGEYAYEDSSDINGKGYYAQALYEFSDAAWKPSLTYRYALFNDEFNPLAYGYTDYGYWFQGEIAGNYPLYNNNLKSHMLRAKAEPKEGITVNLFYYNFSLDQPESLGNGVTSDDFGDEIDLTLDWQATERVYVIGVLGALKPGDAAKQWVGGDKDWLYGMFYVSYTL